jgi:hypothetical protein
LVVTIVALERTELLGPTPRRDRHGRANPDARMLLPVPVDQLGAIEVAHVGTVHRFERDAAGTWFYHGAHTRWERPHAHRPDPSMAARIDSALAAFGRTRIERQFPLERDATEYGVRLPEMLILVYRPQEGHPLAQYAVGDVAPDALSRYVLRIGSSAVVTIPNYQIDGLFALIEAARSSL